jgi:predicted DNA-binding mobile mystery protein A
MTTVQLARRLGLQPQSIVGFEKREPAGEITLKQLRRIADALECDVFCAMVPRTSLRERVERRAADLAKLEVESVAHSMALEAQETDPTLKTERIEQRKRAILDHRWSRLWD